MTLFLRLLEISLFLILFFGGVKWFFKQWALAGVKATEDQREVVESQAKVVASSNAKHKGLEKKKKAVKKFKA